MEDQIITLIHQVQNNRNSIWTFYIVIMSTAFGIAFTDNYQKLSVWVRILLTLGVGAAVWYNFFALIGNTLQLQQLVEIAKTIFDSDHPFHKIFDRATLNPIYIHFVYIPVNLSLLVAMWWGTCVKTVDTISTKIKLRHSSKC